ncbi:unnamed protein product [Pedinophyceae sp. YPF-701]|nr:unnamed protein product [Pedinophyceae sp. YPF-701]
MDAASLQLDRWLKELGVSARHVQAKLETSTAELLPIKDSVGRVYWTAAGMLLPSRQLLEGLARALRGFIPGLEERHADLADSCRLMSQRVVQLRDSGSLGVGEHAKLIPLLVTRCRDHCGRLGALAIRECAQPMMEAMRDAHAVWAAEEDPSLEMLARSIIEMFETAVPMNHKVRKELGFAVTVLEGVPVVDRTFPWGEYDHPDRSTLEERQEGFAEVQRLLESVVNRTCHPDKRDAAMPPPQREQAEMVRQLVDGMSSTQDIIWDVHRAAQAMAAALALLEEHQSEAHKAVKALLKQLETLDPLGHRRDSAASLEPSEGSDEEDPVVDRPPVVYEERAPHDVASACAKAALAVGLSAFIIGIALLGWQLGAGRKFPKGPDFSGVLGLSKSLFVLGATCIVLAGACTYFAFQYGRADPDLRPDVNKEGRERAAKRTEPDGGLDIEKAGSIVKSRGLRPETPPPVFSDNNARPGGSDSTVDVHKAGPRAGLLRDEEWRKRPGSREAWPANTARHPAAKNQAASGLRAAAGRQVNGPGGVPAQGGVPGQGRSLTVTQGAGKGGVMIEYEDPFRDL